MRPREARPRLYGDFRGTNAHGVPQRGVYTRASITSIQNRNTYWFGPSESVPVDRHEHTYVRASVTASEILMHKYGNSIARYLERHKEFRSITRASSAQIDRFHDANLPPCCFAVARPRPPPGRWGTSWVRTQSAEAAEIDIPGTTPCALLVDRQDAKLSL